MIRLACVCLGLLASVAWADTPDMADPVTLAREFVKEQATTLDTELKQAPVLPARTIDEIVQLEIVDRQIRIRLLAKDAGDSATIPLKGVNGVCQIQRFGQVGTDGPLSLAIHVFDEKRLRAVNITLSSIVSRTGLDIVLESPGVSLSTQLIAMEESLINGEDVAARLYVQVQHEDGTSEQPSAALEAETPAQLIEANRAQLLECAAEGLKVIRAMHLLSAMSQRQVRHLLMSDIAVPKDTERDLRAALADMELNPESGEKALKAVLDRMGTSAAAALMRMPRDQWSADLTMRIDTILAPYLPDDPRVTDAVRADPSRLIDLLYWPDASTRDTVLKRLQAISPDPIEFDPQKDPYSQVDIIESLRVKWTR